MDWLLRGLRIGASTIAIVELLRSEWLAGGLSSLAWLLFVQVERRRAAMQVASEQAAKETAVGEKRRRDATPTVDVETMQAPPVPSR